MVCPWSVFFPTLQSYGTIMWNACSIISCQLYCSSTLTLGILLSMDSGNIPLKTLRGNTLPCAPVSNFMRIQAMLRGCVSNCTLMCVSVSSRVTVLTAKGLKYSSLGSSQGGDGLSITPCTFLGCCLVVGGCDVDIHCGCCLDLQTSSQWFCFSHFCRMYPWRGTLRVWYVLVHNSYTAS